MKKISKKSLLIGLLLFGASMTLCEPVEKKKVIFINETQETFYIKGPFGLKERFVPQAELDPKGVDVAEFEAAGNATFKIQFVKADSRFSRDSDMVAKEFAARFPQPYTAFIFTKNVLTDSKGNEHVEYQVLTADAFKSQKLIDSKSF